MNSANDQIIKVLTYKDDKVNIKAIHPDVLLRALIALKEIALETLNPIDIRDRFICGFLFWTGVREREMLLTYRRDLDFVEMYYNVPTLKKRHEAKIPIPLTHVPKEEIEYWQFYFDFFNIEMDDLILEGRKVRQNNLATKYARKDLSERQVQNIVKQRLSPLIGHNVHPHMLRHSLGFYLAKINYSDGKIKEILRHSSVIVTALYSKLGAINLKDEMEYAREDAEKRLQKLKKEMGLV